MTQSYCGTLELVGLAEAAALLGITPSALSHRRRSSGRPPGDWHYDRPTVPVPEPIVELRSGPIWHADHIRTYCNAYQQRQRRY